ncbi:hypothetical protein BDQ17DRAFT_1434008 [Cyathus striatus]|nr:hypothetical protein BDQ17DRAFT_1434008 [Cyathus striatus]
MGLPLLPHHNRLPPRRHPRSIPSKTRDKTYHNLLPHPSPRQYRRFQIHRRARYSQIIDRTKGIRPSTYFDGSIVAHAMLVIRLVASLSAGWRRGLKGRWMLRDEVLLHMGKTIVAWGDLIGMNVLPEAKLSFLSPSSFLLPYISTICLVSPSFTLPLRSRSSSLALLTQPTFSVLLIPFPSLLFASPSPLPPFPTPFILLSLLPLLPPPSFPLFSFHIILVLVANAPRSYALIATATNYGSWFPSSDSVTAAEAFKILKANADTSRLVTATVLDDLHIAFTDESLSPCLPSFPCSWGRRSPSNPLHFIYIGFLSPPHFYTPLMLRGDVLSHSTTLLIPIY